MATQPFDFNSLAGIDLATLERIAQEQGWTRYAGEAAIDPGQEATGPIFNVDLGNGLNRAISIGPQGTAVVTDPYESTGNRNRNLFAALAAAGSIFSGWNPATPAAPGAPPATPPAQSAAVASPVAKPGADAVTSIAAGGGQDTVMNAIRQFFGGDNALSSLLPIFADIYGSSKAEDALDKLTQNDENLAQRRDALADGLENRAFEGYNVRLGPTQGVITSDEASATGGDPMTLANQLMARYQAQQAPYREGQFRALEQRLESQGLLGLKGPGGEGGNPFHQAFAKGLADSDAAAFQQIFGQAQDAANSEVNRAATTLNNARALQSDRLANLGKIADFRAGTDAFRNSSTANAIGSQLSMDQRLIDGLRKLFS